MIIIVSGNTFDHRYKLKALGGNWSNADKRWTFYFPSEATLTVLRSMIGVLVTEASNSRFTQTETQKPTSYFRRTPTQFYGDDPTYMGEFASKNPIAFFGFSTLGACIDYVEQLKRPDNQSGTCDVGWSTSLERIKATGTNNMQEALDLARDGWTEGFGLIEAFDLPHALNKHRLRSYAGGNVSVGRMLAGNPKHMMRRAPQPKNKRITLFVETMMWMGISAENAMLRALLIAGVIDIAEQQGFSCDIYAVGSSLSWHDRKPQAQICVQLKTAGERLSLLDIMFGLGHPSFLRRFYFACEGCVEEIDMNHAERGIVDAAFNPHNMSKDCYYFGQLAGNVQATAWQDPMRMLKTMLPPNLPVKVKGIENA